MKLKLIKQIKSKEGKLHFERFSIFSTKYFSLYFHKIYEKDEDDALHNHPWNALFITTKNSYTEQLDTGEELTVLPFSLRYRSRKRYHKILRLHEGTVHTIAFVFGKRDDNWGYLVNGKHMIHTDYRNNKNQNNNG